MHFFFASEKYVCLFCSIKICALGLDKLLESIFCLLLIVEAFFLQKGVQLLVIWQEMNFVAQFVQ